VAVAICRVEVRISPTQASADAVVYISSGRKTFADLFDADGDTGKGLLASFMIKSSCVLCSRSKGSQSQ